MTLGMLAGAAVVLFILGGALSWLERNKSSGRNDRRPVPPQGAAGHAA